MKKLKYNLKFIEKKSEKSEKAEQINYFSHLDTFFVSHSLVNFSRNPTNIKQTVFDN